MPEDAAAINGNGYVRVREFYIAMQDQNKRMDEMERRLLARMDAMASELKETSRTPPVLISQMASLDRALTQEVKDRRAEDENLQEGVDQAKKAAGAVKEDVNRLELAAAKGDKTVGVISAVFTAVAAILAGWLGTR
jgi:nitrate/nitrite-specific signal transduction histidine kinase